MRDGARGIHLVVFTRALLCVNIPLAPFYTRKRTVTYGVVIVSRNLEIERTNQNDGFKMTALEYCMSKWNYLRGQSCFQGVSNVYTVNIV